MIGVEQDVYNFCVSTLENLDVSNFRLPSGKYDETKIKVYLKDQVTETYLDTVYHYYSDEELWNIMYSERDVLADAITKAHHDVNYLGQVGYDLFTLLVLYYVDYTGVLTYAIKDTLI